MYLFFLNVCLVQINTNHTHFPNFPLIQENWKKNNRKSYYLATLVDSFREVYFTKNIDNLLVQVVSPTSNKTTTFILHYITILYSIFDSNKCMTCLFWSHTKTTNFLRCLELILYLLEVSVMFFCLKSNGH